MNNLRETFWILTCRAATRSIINNCWTCKRYRVKRVEAVTGSLPYERVKEANIFEITGVDYIGPLFLKKSQKAWICLFTCAVYRAIHLELTTSLSTEAFIQVLRRFIVRRGKPSIIYSDNGTNFVGTRNLLQKIDWGEIKRFGTSQKIVWRLNPPSAPWWGRWWERLVRMIKDILKRTLKKACLFYEEMNTILCDIEVFINSRPLTYLAEDPTHLQPLTPMTFLQEIPRGDVSELDKIDINLNKRMRYCQSLRKELRKRFRSEYLGQLTRRKTKGRDISMKVGDIVLVGQNNRKRPNWPLARIIKTYPGKDGVVRVAKVKTASGELVRPIQRLYPSETSEAAETSRDEANQPEEISEAAEASRDEENQTEEDQSEEGERRASSLTEPNVTQTRSGRYVKKLDRFDY